MMSASKAIKKLGCALLWIFFLSTSYPYSCSALGEHNNEHHIHLSDGLASVEEGKRLFELQQYEEAVPFFWNAILKYKQPPGGEALYNLEEVFNSFINCFAIRGKTIDGFLFIVREAIKGNQLDMAKIYLQQASIIDPDHEEVQQLRSVIFSDDDNGTLDSKSQPFGNEMQRAVDLYNQALVHFDQKRFSRAASLLEEVCELRRDDPRFWGACTHAVYCRAQTNDWGLNGEQYEKDMERIVHITSTEILENKLSLSPETKGVQWKSATSVMPHMMLGYPVDPSLKRQVAESHAFMNEVMARFDKNTGAITPLPPDLPYDMHSRRESFKDSKKIRIGFVSAAFSSKAVLYLSHDMFRFFDKSKFEVHIFSAGPPDHPNFIENAMNGVDWRERVRQNVDFFHDIQDIKDNHVEVARMIHDKEIHILIEWDGYAREASRVNGLFALKPAPIQILHQEYLGTYGGEFVDYIITDKITSPEESEDYYSEKFIYMPNHFFSKGHAVQNEINPPTYDFKPAQKPYVLGTGSPQENRCLSHPDLGPEEVSFVFCNFNKFLKFNPETVRSWMEILKSVPDSILCLLENPQEGIPNLRDFVTNVGGDELNQRIHFLPWAQSPFVHQTRNRDFCNAVLDNSPYNGHTTAQDALYAGVPIVTRSDRLDMSSRVSTSANTVLGMEDLNAKDGIKQYIEIATKLGTNTTYFQSKRNKLISSCLQKNPMHPYWDVERYVANFEKGLRLAWERYLAGDKVEHIIVDDVRAEESSLHSEL